ncbi:hypothetical protein [Candidatus Nanohalococcus occultus]|uniref:Uncharacterized protein n=1 Tax=Candidatus Nanohalococcus occultus TaxID=2978047 RepID=A0ABY8CJ67_9ARCH|nr:hypothetical protein SVXNc_0351 [Candidatus Nanohaloarchaeota archaeon SVXNc]
MGLQMPEDTENNAEKTSEDTEELEPTVANVETYEFCGRPFSQLNTDSDQRYSSQVERDIEETKDMAREPVRYLQNTPGEVFSALQIAEDVWDRSPSDVQMAAKALESEDSSLKPENQPEQPETSDSTEDILEYLEENNTDKLHNLARKGQETAIRELAEEIRQGLDAYASKNQKIEVYDRNELSTQIEELETQGIEVRGEKFYGTRDQVF